MSVSVYKPLQWQAKLGYRINPDWCQAAVHDRNVGVGFNQCCRKPTCEVEAVKFCTQHGKMARAQGVWHRRGAAL